MRCLHNWVGRVSADLAKDVALRLVACPLGRAPIVKGDEAVINSLGSLLACMQNSDIAGVDLLASFLHTPKQANSRCSQAFDMS